MKNFISTVKALFKPVAIIKYLFFPFMIANAQGSTDLKSIIGNERVVAQLQTQTSTWVATNNGLYQISRISGKFVHLTTSNSAMPSNHITGMCATSNEHVYVVTDNGIVRFDGVGFVVLNTENTNLPANSFTSVTCDERGRVFVGTTNHGLVMIDGMVCKTFNTTNSAFTSNTVTNVYCDENGIIIAEQGNGNQIAIGLKTTALIVNPQNNNDVTANTN